MAYSAEQQRIRREAKARGEEATFLRKGEVIYSNRAERARNLRVQRTAKHRLAQQIDPRGMAEQIEYREEQPTDLHTRKRSFAELRRLQDTEYEASERAHNSEAAILHRDEALFWARRMQADYPEEYAEYMAGRDAREQENMDPVLDDDEPTYEQLLAHYAGKRILVGSGRTSRWVDPKHLTPEALQAIDALDAETLAQVVQDDPEQIINDYNAGPGPTPEQMARLAQMQEEQEQRRTEREAVREQRRAEAKAERDAARLQAKAEREVAGEAKAKAAEQRRAEAKAEREQAAQAAAQAKATAQAQKEAAAAQAKAAADQQKDAEEQARLAAIKQQQQAEREAKQRKLYLDTVGRAANVANSTGVQVGNWPRPGGIGLLLVVILFMVFAIVPMNHQGDTRLQLMWLAITGKVKLPTSDRKSTNLGEGSNPAIGGKPANHSMPGAVGANVNQQATSPLSSIALAAASDALGSSALSDMALSALPAASRD